MSIAVFQVNGDNIFAINDQQAPGGVDIVLARHGQLDAAPKGTKLVFSPTERGLVLDRRLATTPQSLAEADRVRRFDRCAPM
jgi:uncharacterized membrane protein